MREFRDAIVNTAVSDPFDRIRLFFDATQRRLEQLNDDVTRAGKSFADVLNQNEGIRSDFDSSFDNLVEEANLLKLERNTWLLLFGVYKDIHEKPQVRCFLCSPSISRVRL